jgi:hypothetical protein
MVNTAAIRAPNIPISDLVNTTSRISASAPTGIPRSNSARSVARIAPARNSSATNSRPEPRNTVANSLSSRSPSRVRITPMNQRNAIPANGMSATAICTPCRRSSSVSQSVDGLPAGTEAWNWTSTTIRMTEKMIPATAAEAGFRNCLTSDSDCMRISSGRAGAGYCTSA